MTFLSPHIPSTDCHLPSPISHHCHKPVSFSSAQIQDQAPTSHRPPLKIYATKLSIVLPSQLSVCLTASWPLSHMSEQSANQPS